MDNKVALTYMLKMEGTHSPEFLKISKSIWHYLLPLGVIITAEHLPNKLNVQEDRESQNANDPSDWKLHQRMFQSIIKHFGYPTVNLFASVRALPSTSTICRKKYVAWKPDPKSKATDAMQQCWNRMFPYASPFQPDQLNSEKDPSRKSRTNDNSCTNMENTTLVSPSVRDVNAMYC